MKQCPRCRQDFEDWVANCPECPGSPPLAATLPAGDPLARLAAPPSDDWAQSPPEVPETLAEDHEIRRILEFNEREIQRVRTFLDESAVPHEFELIRGRLSGRNAERASFAVLVSPDRFVEAVDRLKELFGLTADPAESAEENCPSCGDPVSPGEKVCGSCGLALVVEPDLDHPFARFVAELEGKKP